MTGPSKAELRAALLKARSSLDPATRQVASARAAAHLAALPAYARAKAIALYSAFRAEADPAALAHRLGSPLRVAFPAVTPDGLVFRWARPEALEPGRMGIWEPPSRCPEADLEAIELFVVPGLGFTRGGDRLGYGRGHYDRALSAARAARPDVLAIGFAFEVQWVDGLPTEPHDQRLDGVVTENGFTPAEKSAL